MCGWLISGLLYDKEKEKKARKKTSLLFEALYFGLYDST